MKSRGLQYPIPDYLANIAASGNVPLNIENRLDALADAFKSELCQSK